VRAVLSMKMHFEIEGIIIIFKIMSYTCSSFSVRLKMAERQTCISSVWGGIVTRHAFYVIFFNFFWSCGIAVYMGDGFCGVIGGVSLASPEACIFRHLLFSNHDVTAAGRYHSSDST
jgi:hypothetical protein